MEPYDPERYWDTKARGATSALGAVCLGDPVRDRCIDRMQRALMRGALDRLRGRFAGARASVLDLGCGTGRWAETLARSGFAYRGIDTSGTMVEIARRENPGHRFHKFDGEHVPFDDAAFDVVLCLAVLHHNPYERQEALLDEVARVLRPDGALVLFEGVRPRGPTGNGVFHYRRATYFALERIAQKLLPERLLPTRMLLRVGTTVDPSLLWLIPRVFHDRWFALTRKNPVPRSAPPRPDRLGHRSPPWRPVRRRTDKEKAGTATDTPENVPPPR